MKNLLLFILALLLNQNLFAQKHYLEGFIVQNSGDSIRGFIDYGNWNDNPDYINFRSTQDAETIKYLPHEISAFGVANELFESSFIYHEISPRSTAILKFNPDLVLDQKQVFLRILFKGEKTLASYKTHSGIDNYYIHYGDKYELLIFKKYFQIIDGNKVIKTNKKYIGQLSLYLNDCSEISSKIASVLYSEASMIKLFHSYYKNCNQGSQIHIAKIENDIFNWSVLVGATHQTLSFYNYIVRNDTYEMSPYVSFVVGGAVDITFKRSFKHWSLNNELLLSYIKTEGESPLVDYYIYNYELDFTYLSMNNMFRYQYEFGQFQVFANFGITNGYAISFSSVEKRYNTFNGQTKILEMGMNRRMEFGRLFGIGARFQNRYQLEVRYQSSNGMSPYVDAPSNIKRWFVLFSYRF